MAEICFDYRHNLVDHNNPAPISLLRRELYTWLNKLRQILAQISGERNTNTDSLHLLHGNLTPPQPLPLCPKTTLTTQHSFQMWNGFNKLTVHLSRRQFGIDNIYRYIFWSVDDRKKYRFTLMS